MGYYKIVGHLAMFFMGAIIGQITAMHSTRGKFDFKGGAPNNPAAAQGQLNQLLFNPSAWASQPGPLDPLTEIGIRTAALIIRATNRTSNLLFKSIGLKDPVKADLLPYFLQGTVPRRGKIDRKADVIVVNATSKASAFVVVNLSTLKLESWVDNTRPELVPISFDDLTSAQDIVLSDPGVLARITALGFNSGNIYADVWDPGFVDDNATLSAIPALVRVYLYVNLGKGDNIYAHPLDFLVFVDLGAKQVVLIEDLPIYQDFDTSDRTGNSVPMANSNYFPESMTPNYIRKDVRPIAISRPEGVSFEVKGRLVSWQNFQFRVGYTPREGLVIHQVTYSDYGKIRPLFYRMSLSEIFIFFGDPRPPYHRKSSHDEGKFLLGHCSISLSHEFCRGQAHYYDSVIHNDNAETTVVKNSTCIYEEDAGLLWAFYDPASGRTAVTRSQRLSVSSLIAIGSCTYLISWRFYQDGTIELNMRLTGVPNTNLMAVDVKAPVYGNLMDKQVYTQNFQYFIATRLDADIGGVNNTASTEDIVSSPPERNPFGNGIETQSTVFKLPGDSLTDIKPGRSWKTSNPNEVHPVTGRPISWKLIPQGPNMPPLLTLTPLSPLWSGNHWGAHNMWVLPFSDDQYQIDVGVPKWVKTFANSSIENTDIVLWHVFGFAYTSDPEDYPVVSAYPADVGFKLRPSNFFIKNPAVTVPQASQTTAFDDHLQGCTNNYSPAPGPGWKKFYH